MCLEKKNLKQFILRPLQFRFEWCKETERKMLLLCTFKNTVNTFGWRLKAWQDDKKTDSKRATWSLLSNNFGKSSKILQQIKRLNCSANSLEVQDSILKWSSDSVRIFFQICCWSFHLLKDPKSPVSNTLTILYVGNKSEISNHQGFFSFSCDAVENFDFLCLLFSVEKAPDWAWIVLRFQTGPTKS